MEWIINNWANIAFAITSVVTAASAIAALTPTPKDDAIISKIYKFLIEIPALNIGKAKQ
jgi:hypothetical protein